MRDELLGYYERELIYLRQMGADFAQKYPKIASRLLLESDKCEDPHVERLIEGFAFLASRIHLKVDDEFPEVTESFLNILYPHYLAPVPSMSIARFSLDPTQGKLTTGYTIKRESVLYSRPVQGTPCRFRSCYPVTLWPVEVPSASFESLDPVDTKGKWQEAVIRIQVRCLNNTKFSELAYGEEATGGKTKPIDRLRFFINGEPQLVYPLYEALFNHVTQIELRPIQTRLPSARLTRVLPKLPSPVFLKKEHIQAVGFGEDEGMLPYTARSFAGYRLLTEYFAFPDKFLFFDLTGLDSAAQAGFGEQFEVRIYLRNVMPPRSPVNADTFQLGCTPIINLYEKLVEPIQLTEQQNEYRVIADVNRQRATEIYQIESVSSTNPYLQQTRHFQPFYSFRHTYDREYDRTFWYATRRPSQVPEDAGTEVYLSLVDLDFNPNVPAIETINVRAICTNRDLPAKLPYGSKESDFEVEGAATLSRVQCLKKPTGTLRPPLRRGAQWRLISHLTLNHLSLVEHQGEPEALREILLLYDFMDSNATRKQINGIKRVTSRRVMRQTGMRVGTGFVRGLETTIEFDEEQYVGSGLFLFASVLEHFLAIYASVNSFSQLIAVTQQREGYLKRWPPRAGEQIIL